MINQTPTIEGSAMLAAPRRFRGAERAVLLDCDGVLLDWIAGFRVFAEDRLGRALCPVGPTRFDMFEWLGVKGRDEVLPLIVEFNGGACGGFGRLPLMPGAREAMETMRAAGRELHVITACSEDETVRALRRSNLLDAFGDVFAEVHCVGLSESKRLLLDEHVEGVWVEDKFENAVEGAESGHDAYLLRHSYNRHQEDGTVIPRLRWVDDWAEIAALEAGR